MKIAFLEPHLSVGGRSRHVIELGNELVRRGHEVSYLLPSSEPLRCHWIECLGRIHTIESTFRHPFDLLVFNDDSQWLLVDRFKDVGLTIHYLLGYGVLEGRPASRESYRFPVDLRLANSQWTAERINDEIGVRPAVVLPGINRAHFRPVRVRQEYDVLSLGSGLEWKGAREVEEACLRLGIRLEKWEGKDLPQSKMAQQYCRARVFAVGSYLAGFGTAGLEALACGVPLVTTDNGGCREYAVHEQTALVVPPREVEALAAAIDRLLKDQALASRLRKNGLKLVRDKFQGWTQSARRFEEIAAPLLEARRRLTLAIDRRYDDPRLETYRRNRAAQVVAYTRPLALPSPSSPPPAGLASVIALSWDQPYYLERLVESIRANTGGSYELIIVDNGSREDTRRYVRSAADKHLLNSENVGFARGMNQGAGLAVGEYLVFINSDAEVPAEWLPKLIEAQQSADRVGIVAPAVTAGGSFVTVRAEQHEIVREVLPFSLPPAAVCYLVPRAEFEGSGGWCEEYRLGGAEDVDLCFTMWARGRRVLVDERVLIVHHSKGTAAAKLDNWEEIWRQNRELLIDRWSAAEPLTAPPDGELAGVLAELRSAPADRLPPLLDRLESLVKDREQAWAAERAAMAAGAAQSWREAARQREVAAGLRQQLRAGLLRRLYRRMARRG